MTRSLTIAIDARWIFSSLSGIGRYTLELAHALIQLDSPHRFILLFDQPELAERHGSTLGLKEGSRAMSCLFPYGLFSPVSQLFLPRKLRSLGVDVYHSTNYMMPLVCTAPPARIVTIHDLIPLLFRDHAPRSKKNRMFPVYRQLMHTIARNADAIIAVSEATRRDLIAHLHAAAERIHVTMEGVDPRYCPAPSHPARGNPPLILYVGRRDPYKNVPLLIEAFAGLRETGVAARLRIIGPEDSRYPEARETATRFGLEAEIQWDGYVTDEELVRAYQQASAFVLPSRYEGFGLPVLEAMACGTPVLCSNTSSLPEVGGDAAIYLDPLTKENLKKQLAELFSSPDAWLRRSEQGIAHAARFTWAETARKTIAVYEQIGFGIPGRAGPGRAGRDASPYQYNKRNGR